MIDLGQYFTAVREEDGIAFCSLEDNTASKFSEEMQDGLFQLEDASWWFQYRADVIASLAEQSFVFDRTTIDCGGGEWLHNILYAAAGLQNRTAGTNVSCLQKWEEEGAAHRRLRDPGERDG